MCPGVAFANPVNLRNCARPSTRVLLSAHARGLQSRLVSIRVEVRSEMPKRGSSLARGGGSFKPTPDQSRVRVVVERPWARCLR
ncbi:MAG: hypothetical protein ACI91F_000082 [Candidatus Binatia bacterium]|jgi:hypothetical protein